MDTIFAVASARGRAGVAVIRISGPQAFAAAEALAGRLPPVRRASVRKLRVADDFVDEAIVVCFSPGASFTGEPVVELQTHGSPAVLSALLRVLAAQAGLRAAGPGEFTRRALENGRLDLAQVEGLADLIDAETEAQRRQAMRVLGGALGAEADIWRRDLVRAAALIEATIDFADEDVPVDVGPEVGGLMERTQRSLAAQLDGYQASERVRDGFEVAIVGRPNIGKSTLLNALARREAAITSEVAGTTRDVIEVRMELGGLAVTLLDTAGLRDTIDRIEALGVGLARHRAGAADLRILLVGPGEEPAMPPRPGDLVVWAKADLAPAPAGQLAVSGKSGDGIAELVQCVTAELSDRVKQPALIIRERHRVAISVALEAVGQAFGELLCAQPRADIVAEHLRHAIRALDSLIGRVDVEDLLGEIFARFCIGK